MLATKEKFSLTSLTVGVAAVGRVALSNFTFVFVTAYFTPTFTAKLRPRSAIASNTLPNTPVAGWHFMVKYISLHKMYVERLLKCRQNGKQVFCKTSTMNLKQTPNGHIPYNQN